MRFVKSMLLILMTCSLGTKLLAIDYTPGNIVVSRVGDGSTTLSSAATTVSLVELTPTGASASHIVDLPSFSTGGNNQGGLTDSGTATGGGLNLSSDGRFLTLIGIDAQLGTPSVSSTSPIVANRTVASVDIHGNVTIKARLTTTSTARAAVSSNGDDIWIVGDNSDVQYINTPTTSVSVGTPIGSVLGTAIYGGILFSANGSSISSYNAPGTPPTGTVTPIRINFTQGTGGGINFGTGSFVFLDRVPNVGSFNGLDTLYLVDGSAVEKYEWNPLEAGWAARGSFNGGNTLFGLAARINGANVDIFATRQLASDNKVMKVTDGSFGNFASGSMIQIASAGPNFAFRGIAFAALPTISEFSPSPPTIVNENTVIGPLTFNTNGLNATANSTNTAVVPNANISINGSTQTKSLNVTPAANQFGTTSITVAVTDGEGNNVQRSFTVTFNDVPLVTGALAKNTPASSISAISSTTLGATDGDNTQSELLFTLTSVPSKGGLLKFPSPNAQGAPTLLSIGSTFSAAEVAALEIAYQNDIGSGTDSFVMNLADGNGGAVNGITYTLTISGGATTPPTVSSIGNFTVNEDQSSGSIFFTATDAETSPPPLLVLTAQSDNQALLPDANIAKSGPDASGNCSLALTPAPNAFGTAAVSVRISDGATFTLRTFTFTVNSVNDLPNITAVSNQTLNLQAISSQLAFAVSDIETAPGALTVTSNSSNVAVVPAANVALGGSGGNRTVRVTAGDTVGTTTITLTVQDADGGSRQTTFDVSVQNPQTVVVKNVNDAGADSLRDCMTRAQRGDTITFDPAVFSTALSNASTTIALLSPLPSMDDSLVTIDSHNQRVTVNGAGANGIGFNIVSNNNKLMGLALVNFTQQAILISGGASGNAIGGSRQSGTGPQGQGLRIGGGGSFGIEISGTGTNANVVRGCWIGLGLDGISANANEFGLIVRGGATANIIGGEGSGEENTISGNNQDGLVISDAGTEDNEVINNNIGISAISPSGGEDDFFKSERNVGNKGAGLAVTLGARNTTVGGRTGTRGNRIGFNQGAGVDVRDVNAIKISIVGNRISQNGGNNGKGIKLLSGANNNIQAPVITGIVGRTQKPGNAKSRARNDGISNLFGTAGQSGDIDIFTDFGTQGAKLVGNGQVTNGAWFVTLNPAVLLSGTQKVTAIFTDANGNTSEFSVANATSTDIDGDAKPDLTDNDGDNDGFDDTLEETLGSIPDSPSSIPGSLVATNTFKAAKIFLSFKTPPKPDTISFSGSLPVRPGTILTGQQVIIDVGGAHFSDILLVKGATADRAFTLSAKVGRDGKTIGSARAPTADVVTKFTVKFPPQTYAANFIDEGLINPDQVKPPPPAKNVNVLFTILFNGKVYQQSKAMSYKATHGVSGTASSK